MRTIYGRCDECNFITQPEKFPEAYRCTLCNKAEVGRYMNDGPMREAQYCWSCWYWTNFKVEENTLISDAYEVYTVNRYVENPRNKSWLGYGGREFMILWNDSRRLPQRCNDLWNRGDVPLRFRHKFPPNGTLKHRGEEWTTPEMTI